MTEPTIDNLLTMISKLLSIEEASPYDLQTIRHAAGMLAESRGEVKTLMAALDKERREHNQHLQEMDYLLMCVRMLVIEDDPGQYASDKHQGAWEAVKVSLAAHGYGDF